MNTYLDLAHQGKNQWWRFALALTIIFFIWFVLGSIPYFTLGLTVLADSDPNTYFDSAAAAFSGIDPLLPFVALMVSFVFFFVSIYLAVRFVHQRPFSTLIAPVIRWGRLAQAFGLWLLLAAIIAVFEAVLHPTRYQLTFDLIDFTSFTIAALIFVPIQTSAEELFFRGYVLQSLGLRLRNIVVLSLLSGFIFMAPHLSNPEVSVDFLLLPVFYFVFGAFLAFVTLKDGGLEIALGVHAANNLFSAIFANYAGSALATSPIFTATELDAGYNLVSAIVAMGVLYLWFFWPATSPAAPQSA